VLKHSNAAVIFTLVLITVFAVTACADSNENSSDATNPVPATEEAPSGGSEPVVSEPDIANGESKFKGLGCSGCHSTDTDKKVGPGLSGVGSKGDDYIRESIVDPSVVIVDGFSDLMPKTFANLKASDVDDLVAYLKTLG
jgi:hypothetical protein